MRFEIFWGGGGGRGQGGKREPRFSPKKKFVRFLSEVIKYYCSIPSSAGALCPAVLVEIITFLWCCSSRRCPKSRTLYSRSFSRNQHRLVPEYRYTAAIAPNRERCWSCRLPVKTGRRRRSRHSFNLRPGSPISDDRCRPALLLPMASRHPNSGRKWKAILGLGSRRAMIRRSG